MIIKKIKNPKLSSTKAERVINLTSYIARPGAGEKLLYSGALNFFAGTFSGKQVEMLSVAEGAARSADPINHYVLSWKEGELPREDQIKEALEIFIKELGALGLHLIYGVHQDTQNVHLHIAISRVDPDNGKVRELQKGFDIEAGHRAIALIENRQGWEREGNSRYQVVNGVVERCAQSDVATAKPKTPVRDQEIRLGEKSAQSVGIENAGPVIKSAKSWAELHGGLQQMGMKFEKKGSGAIIWIGDIPVKASSVDRSASMSVLIKRLGEFKPAVTDNTVKALQPSSLRDDQPGWPEYRKDRELHYANRDQARTALATKIDIERSAIFKRQKTARDALFMSRQWKGGGDQLNAARSLLAAKHAAEKAESTDAHRKARALTRYEFRAFPTFEDWLRSRGQNAQAEAYRHSQQENLISGTGTGQASAPSPTDIRSFAGVSRGREVHYTRHGEHRAAFVDRGHQISILKSNDSGDLLAALQLGAAKWGALNLSGSEEFKRRAVALAIEHGIKISNPELQEMIGAQRIGLQQNRRKSIGDWREPAKSAATTASKAPRSK